MWLVVDFFGKYSISLNETSDMFIWFRSTMEIKADQ